MSVAVLSLEPNNIQAAVLVFFRAVASHQPIHQCLSFLSFSPFLRAHHPLAFACIASGMVINMTSNWGRTVSAMVGPYCTSKWAVEGLTKVQLRVEGSRKSTHVTLCALGARVFASVAATFSSSRFLSIIIFFGTEICQAVRLTGFCRVGSCTGVA